MVAEACVIAIIIGIFLLLIGVVGNVKLTIGGMVLSGSVGAVALILGLLCAMGVSIFGG